MQSILRPSSVDVRWLIRRDLEAVLEIDWLSFEQPLDEVHFIGSMRHTNIIGLVAERDDAIVGYMIYATWKNRMEVCRMAVHPHYRRHGVGRAMIDRIKKKLSPTRRKCLCALVYEYWLDAQMFFAANGFFVPPDGQVESLADTRHRDYRMEYWT